MKDSKHNISAEAYEALEILSFNLKHNERLERLILQVVMGWYSAPVPDSVIMTYNSTLKLWVIPKLEDELLGDEGHKPQIKQESKSSEILKKFLSSLKIIQF